MFSYITTSQVSRRIYSCNATPLTSLGSCLCVLHPLGRGQTPQQLQEVASYPGSVELPGGGRGVGETKTDGYNRKHKEHNNSISTVTQFHRNIQT